MSAIELKALSKSYGEVIAVRSLDLTVAAGEFITLLGPSGCGKTTTLRMVAGFARPTRGRVTFGDRDVTYLPPHKREVGLVFQNYALFPHMSVHENVEFGLRMHGVGKDERRRRVGEALDLVRLESLAERLPRQLSGGQQQRVAIARALVIRPAVLLLDEPFGALDKQLRDHMRVELRTLQRLLGISTIFVTHDQDEALAMSDRICVMSNGDVQQLGAPTEIYERPTNRFVAEFMGRSNLLPGTVVARHGDRVTVDFAGMQAGASGAGLPMGSTVAVMIRPEKVAIQAAVANSSGMTGIIKNAVYLGSVVHFDIELASGPTVQVMRQNPTDPALAGLSTGTRVAVTIPAEAVYVLGGEATI